jgi:FkbM family methyltransferase
MRPLVNFLKRTVPPSLLLNLLTLNHLRSKVSELNLIEHLVDKESNSVDIGVYLGVFSKVMSQYSRNVYSFEPHPDHFKFINRALPSNVKVFNMALSNEEGESKLFVPRKHPSAGKIGASSDRRDVTEYAVKRTVLDNFNFTGVGLIKIDAEGHEFEILKGGTKTISENKPNLIVEVEQRHQKRNVNEVFDLIRNFGYQGYFFHQGKINRLEKFKTDMQSMRVTSPDYVNNFLFIPHERIVKYPFLKGV